MIGKRILLFALIWVVAGPSSFAESPQQQAVPEPSATLPVVTIGFVTDGPFRQMADVREQVRIEIEVLADREFDVRFPDYAQIVGDWTIETASRNVDLLLADDRVDIVVAGGVLSSHVVATMADLAKPVVATIVLDPELQGIPYESGRSGRKNLTYILLPTSLERDLDVFQEISPFTNLSILINESFLSGLSSLSELVKARPDRGFGRELIPIGSSNRIDEWLDAIDPKTDAVYLLPISQYSREEMKMLAAALIERNLPSFSFMGETGVEDGILGSLNPDFSSRLARRIGLNVQQIMLGTEAGELNVDLVVSERLTINMNTARALGVAPPVRLMIEADRLIGQELSVGEGDIVSLPQAVKNGVIENLAFVVEGQRVAVGEQDPRIARSAFLPQIGASAVADVIDERRATIGLRPERAVDGSLSLSQLVFADDVFAHATIREKEQIIREYELDIVYLDITRDISVLYLELLRSLSLERIQTDNLRVTRTNLDLARIRESLGQAGAGEVIRWESKIAGDRKARIESFGSRKVKKIALSQALNRPLKDPFQTVDVSMEEDSFLLGSDVIEKYFRNTRDFSAMQDFLVTEGLLNAPELVTFDEALAIQDRLLSSANRAFYLPDLFLQGSVNKYLATGGVGSEPGDSPGGFMPDFSKANWNVGFRLNFPIFTGFARSAERTKAQLEREQIATSRQLATQILEQRIRSQVELTGTFYASIDQARKAADAANRSIDLVQESYANGLADILDLIDAQNTVLITEEAVSNAIYDFLISVSETERAIGLPGVYMSEVEQANFIERLGDYVVANR